MEPVPSITHAQLYSLLKRGVRPFLIDVRDSDFGEGGIIKGAVHVPSYNLLPQIPSIITRCLESQINDIICYCALGKARSVQCASEISLILRSLKPTPLITARYLTGGFRMFRGWYNDTEFIVHP
jgi:rhodanese-related sulfurtransferase